MTTITRFITRHVFLAILLALVALALLLTAARLFTPTLLAAYTDDIAAMATDRLGRPVTIGSLSARWRGVGPVLVLRDVTLWQDDRSTTALELDEIEVDFGAADMLTSGYLAPGRITVHGAHLTVVRHRDGKLSLRGIEQGEGDISTLLLGTPRARLLDARVEWMDEMRPRPPVVLEAADVLVRNDDERHQLDADFSLDGGRVRLRADLAVGRPDRLADWSGDIYLRTEELNLSPLLAADMPAEYVLRTGTGTVELWGKLAAGRIRSLTGHGNIRDLRVAGTKGAVFNVEATDGRFDWRRNGRGWRLDVDELAFRRSGRSWPAGRLSMETRYAGSTTESWRLRSDYVDLADLFAAVAIRPPAHGLLADLLATRPRGVIRDLDLWFRPRARSGFAVSAEIQKLSMAALGRLPTLDNFSGRMHATNNGGRLVLATRNASLHPVRLFRWPIPVARLEGELHWQRGKGGWQLSTTDIEAANRHLSTRTRMHLDLGNTGGPFLDLQTDFRNGVATYAPLYYPAGIMAPKLVEWLDRSITDGRVPWGSFILRGPLRDFPFHRTHSGHFEVLFGVEDAFLDYREDWPPLQDVVADVRFHNNSLEIFNASARIYDSRLSHLEAQIESLKPLAPLRIHGEALGPLEDVIRLLREPPLRDAYRPLVEGTVAGGDSRLELGFALPLRRGSGELALEGTLAFDNSTLTNHTLGLHLSAIEGPLEISRGGVSARRIHAKLAGNRIAASVIPTPTGTRIQASGRLDTRSIKTAYPALVPAPMEGASEWNLAVSIPPPTRLASTGVVFEAVSQLEGTRVDLPLGLGKSAQERRPFKALVAVASGGIGDVELTFGDLHLTGKPGAGGWEARIDSPAADGRIVLPPPGPRQQPVRAEFDRLSVTIDPKMLRVDSAASRPRMDPAAIPEIDLAAREVFINGNPYGELTARTRRTALGIRMEEMRLRSPDGELSLSGDWTSAGAQQRTALELEIKTTDLGRTFRDLAISQAVADGEGRIEAEAEWQGSPIDIRRETLSGHVRFRAEEGRFDEADPGVGRLFGLLNVGALQRRLRLDFSDLFQHGFAFEKIEGEFTISDGVARTDDTRITGPSGDIRIEGLTDFASTEMDQDIYVVPSISGAVALAGGVAGGPLVGAALLAAGKGIDRLATVHYRMTGPWNDPRVERAAHSPPDDDAPAGTGLPEIH